MAAYPASRVPRKAMKTEKETPMILLRKLPCTSLGEDNKTPMAMGIPISIIPSSPVMKTGRIAAKAKLIPFENSAVLKSFKNDRR